VGGEEEEEEEGRGKKCLGKREDGAERERVEKKKQESRRGVAHEVYCARRKGERESEREGGSGGGWQVELAKARRCATGGQVSVHSYSSKRLQLKASMVRLQHDASTARCGRSSMRLLRLMRLSHLMQRYRTYRSPAASAARRACIATARSACVYSSMAQCAYSSKRQRCVYSTMPLSRLMRLSLLLHPMPVLRLMRLSRLIFSAYCSPTASATRRGAGRRKVCVCARARVSKCGVYVQVQFVGACPPPKKKPGAGL
jgi:hypothetical protein